MSISILYPFGEHFLILQLTSSIEQDEDRVIKHYIMTHPDKFIEPERIKYGDKRVFLDWDPKRN